jgi:uncharacterized Tic20 family protein
MQYQPPQHLQTPEQKQWGLLIHLSQFLNFIVPFGGIVAPVIMWQVKKDEMPAIDAHGKMIVNWTISSIIYGLFSIPLMFLLVGFFTLFAVIIMGIVFPIIGAIKANNGEFWEYPLTIKFLK